MNETRATYAATYATPTKPQLREHDHVRHPFYGIGEIIETRQVGGETQYRIEFPHVTRWLYADALKKEATARQA